MEGQFEAISLQGGSGGGGCEVASPSLSQKPRTSGKDMFFKGLEGERCCQAKTTRKYGNKPCTFVAVAEFGYRFCNLHGKRRGSTLNHFIGVDGTSQCQYIISRAPSKGARCELVATHCNRRFCLKHAKHKAIGGDSLGTATKYKGLKGTFQCRYILFRGALKGQRCTFATTDFQGHYCFEHADLSNLVKNHPLQVSNSAGGPSTDPAAHANRYTRRCKGMNRLGTRCKSPVFRSQGKRSEYCALHRARRIQARAHNGGPSNVVSSSTVGLKSTPQAAATVTSASGVVNYPIPRKNKNDQGRSKASTPCQKTIKRSLEDGYGHCLERKEKRARVAGQTNDDLSITSPSTCVRKTSNKDLLLDERTHCRGDATSAAPGPFSKTKAERLISDDGSVAPCANHGGSTTVRAMVDIDNVKVPTKAKEQIGHIANWLYKEVLRESGETDVPGYVQVLSNLGLETVDAIVDALTPEDIDMMGEFRSFKLMHKRLFQKKLKEMQK